MIKNDKKLNIIIHIIYICFCLACIIPLIIILSTSLSSETEIIKNGYSIVPRKSTFMAYQYIFKDIYKILSAYAITILSTLGGTILGISFITLTAYTLSRKDFKYRSALGFYIYFTMLFSGGLVPSYILITKYLNMGNTIWVLFVPTLILPYYIFIKCLSRNI